MYQIKVKKSALKDIEKIPRVFLVKIKKAIEALSQNPITKEAKKIQGYNDHYRIRVGMYRVVYQVEKKIEIVMIIKIKHRKDVYRSF